MSVRDRLIGSALIVGALLALWAYSVLSAYQVCRQEQMAAGETAERASSICRLID